MTTCENTLNAELDAKLRKASPLRATMPLQAMHRTSPLRLRNQISPDGTFTPIFDFTSHSSNKGRVWSGRNSGTEGSSYMRRTASLDAIYSKGQWHKEAPSHFTNLILDKATQTPEEWSACSLAEVMLGCSACLAESPTGNYQNSNGNSRRASGSLPTSPWPPGLSVTQTSPNPGDNFEKLIRQRLQRTNKESSISQKFSPIQADHSVLAPSPVLAKPTVCVQACHSPRNGNIPCLPRPLLPRLRSSVEELNQEIERLVLKPSPNSPDDSDEWSLSQQDGRKAPFPDCFRYTRNANTQTPARCSSGASGCSSLRTSPSLSPTMSPPLVQGAVTPPDSPAGHRLHSSFASPHINKFLAREPPDGCERVTLKTSEELSISTPAPGGGASWPPCKPLATFTLLPSLGSAFCAPGLLRTSQTDNEVHCSTSTLIGDVEDACEGGAHAFVQHEEDDCCRLEHGDPKILAAPSNADAPRELSAASLSVSADQ